MITPYKGREINMSEPVKVYRNLHNKLYSIQQNGLVVAHGINFTIKNAKFKVSLAGQAKVRETRQKNVHAFVVGYMTNKTSVRPLKANLTYNPYYDEGFMVHSVLVYPYVAKVGRYVRFTEKGVTIS